MLSMKIQPLSHRLWADLIDVDSIRETVREKGSNRILIEDRAPFDANKSNCLVKKNQLEFSHFALCHKKCFSLSNPLKH